MLEATVICPPTIPVGPVVSPGAAPSKDSSVPALQPTRRTSVTATTKARTSTAERWLLDRLVTVNLPSCFLPSSLTRPRWKGCRPPDPAAGELAGYDISLHTVLALEAPLQNDNTNYASASGQAGRALPGKEPHATVPRYWEQRGERDTW